MDTIFGFLDQAAATAGNVAGAVKQVTGGGGNPAKAAPAVSTPPTSHTTLYIVLGVAGAVVLGIVFWAMGRK